MKVDKLAGTVCLAIACIALTTGAEVGAQEQKKSSGSAAYQPAREPQSLQYVPNAPLVLLGGTHESGIRVSPAIHDRPLGDALKSLFAGLPGARYSLDKEDRSTARVTLQAKNIKLETALSALVEQTGLTWLRTPAGSSTEPMTFRIGRDLQPKGGSLPWNRQFQQDYYRWELQPNKHLYYFAPTFRQYLMPNAWSEPIPLKITQGDSIPYLPLNQESPQAGAGAKTLPEKGASPLPDAHTEWQDWPTLQSVGEPKPGSAPKSGVPVLKDVPYVGRLFTVEEKEERSTFTCPRCHEQVTVVRKKQTPTCPTCGRTFQSEWKFCPYDGARRPVQNREWQFCPHCGKPVRAG